ncbi:hypothetical protein [Mucilaginibacter aquariorum]|uniref:DUF3999 domain-containing protein n=1 Tax=Mucilaginibacter aquariorum TaxID=2967225 RepID=A0ABT1T2A6_9SPHI|nr:hypothetical protein [Mucilaginibacter aquariorum]MCQ6958657.1 hypothetical protein [Mucilaginibacter aquariorum]
MNKILLTLILLANSTCLLAQQTFKYKANIGKVDTSAFYRISLLPGVLAKSNADLSDIRILNQSGKFVPYIFGSQLPVKEQQSFIVFPQTGIAKQPDTTTTFVAENKGHLTINQLYLKLRNTSVDRIVNLAGSDDLANWYAIKENILLSKAGEEGSTGGIYEQLLNFPASTYQYFKIQVNNNRKDAVAILQAGIYKIQLVKPAYTELPDVKFTQRDSAKASRIFITFNEAYPINKLKLGVAGAKYYKRAINIYSIDGKKRNLLGDTEISSVGNNELFISAKTKKILLEVANEDNPPLNISAVTAYQLDQTLVAYLDKGNNYHLLFGDTVAKTPVYDLQFFTDSLQRNLPIVKLGNVDNNPLFQHKTAATSHNIPTWLIWIAIIAVLGLLAFLTLKMTKEVRQRKK